MIVQLVKIVTNHTTLSISVFTEVIPRFERLGVWGNLLKLVDVICITTFGISILKLSVCGKVDSDALITKTNDTVSHDRLRNLLTTR